MQSLQLRPLCVWVPEYDNSLFHGVWIVVRTWNVGLFPVISRQTSIWPRSTLTSTSGQTPRMCGGVSPTDHNHFRPLVSGGSSVVRQRKGAPCGGGRSTVLSSLDSQLLRSDLFGQLDSFGLPSQTGGRSFSGSLLLARRILR